MCMLYCMGVSIQFNVQARILLRTKGGAICNYSTVSVVNQGYTRQIGTCDDSSSGQARFASPAHTKQRYLFTLYFHPCMLNRSVMSDSGRPHGL